MNCVNCRSDDDDVLIKLVFARSYSLETLECVNESSLLWQTVQVLVHAGTRMIVDSCVAVPAASSMWTVQ